jgi:hypothetical protein
MAGIDLTRGPPAILQSAATPAWAIASKWRQCQHGLGWVQGVKCTGLMGFAVIGWASDSDHAREVAH